MKIKAAFDEHKILHALWVGLKNNKRLFKDGKLITKAEVIERHGNIMLFLTSKGFKIHCKFTKQ